MNYSIQTSRKILNACGHYLFLILITIFTVFPFYWMFVTSIKPPTELVVSPTTLWPQNPHIGNYIDIWNTVPLFRYLLNSMYISVLTTFFSLIFSTLSGYALSRQHFKLKALKTVSVSMMLLSQLIPGVMPLVPLYFLLFRLQLVGTHIGVVLTYFTWGLPFCTLMMRSYFISAVPRSIEESATIDGCSNIGIFLRIALPICKPGIVATAIFSFILAWNEFIFASILLTSSSLRTISVGVHDFIGRYSTSASTGMYMACACIATVPTLIVFAFVQKHLVMGLTAGAVKG